MSLLRKKGQLRKEWPSKSQWYQFFKVLTKKEKGVFFIFLILFFCSLIFLISNFYFENTEIKPDRGGVFVEGVIGPPRFINPIYSVISDTDRDLVELIFSGLMKYDKEGKIVPDLAKKYEVKEGGKVYEVYLKEELYWSDGSPLKADDVIFTIKTIQNPDYKSPLRANWLGVEAEKISDLAIRFKLKNPYAPFLENLTLKIIPEKIWKEISAQNFALAIYNLKPIGSGLYRLKDLEQNNLGKITSLTLVQNPEYYGKEPFIPEIVFRFYEKEEDLIKALQRKEIKSFTLTSPKNLPKELFNQGGAYSFSLPRYFAVFFNPEKAKIFDETEVRLALNYGVNKEEIVNEALSGWGKVVHSPILPAIFGFKEPDTYYQFNLEKAKEILEKAGFLENEEGLRTKIVKKVPAFQFKKDLKVGSQGDEVKELQKCLAKDSEIYPEGQITGFFGETTKAAVIKFQEKYKEEILEPSGLKKGTGLVSRNTRKKLNEVCFKSSGEPLSLKFSLTTVDQSPLIEVANFLKKQWKNLGVELEIKTFDISQLSQEIIKTRDYESLLFGEVLSTIPDPFPFWHSIQKKDPGLNLALYENKKADKLLESGRQVQDPKERKEALEKFQDILIEDAPAVLLYSPDYLYFVSNEIKGIKTGIIADPSKRFSEIANWYIKTCRGWK